MKQLPKLVNVHISQLICCLTSGYRSEPWCLGKLTSIIPDALCHYYYQYLSSSSEAAEVGKLFLTIHTESYRIFSCWNVLAIVLYYCWLCFMRNSIITVTCFLLCIYCVVFVHIKSMGERNIMNLNCQLQYSLQTNWLTKLLLAILCLWNYFIGKIFMIYRYQSDIKNWYKNWSLN